MGQQRLACLQIAMIAHSELPREGNIFTKRQEEHGGSKGIVSLCDSMFSVTLWLMNFNTHTT